MGGRETEANPSTIAAIKTLTGSEITQNKALLTQVAKCFITTYGGREWGEGYYCDVEGRSVHVSLPDYEILSGGNESELVSCRSSGCSGHYIPYYDLPETVANFEETMASDEKTIPVVSFWQERDEVRAYTAIWITKDWQRFEDYLVRAPYFGGIHANPREEISEFRTAVAKQLNNDWFVFVLDTVAHPDYRGSPRWWETVFQASYASLAYTRKFVAITQENSSAIYGLLKKLEIIKALSRTTPLSGHQPVLMVYTGHIGSIVEVSQDAMKATNAMSAAQAFVKYLKD